MGNKPDSTIQSKTMIDQKFKKISVVEQIEYNKTDKPRISNVLLGLTNHNNNCYLNSVIQCLNNIESFKILIKNNLKSNDNITSELSRLMEDLSLKNLKFAIDIKGFLAVVRKENELFNNDEHHDAPEFLFWLLDHLHETQRKNKQEGRKSLIEDDFHGKQFSITKCLTCETEFKRHETYISLAVDIESNVSLTSCLKRYIGKEVMKHKDKFYCEICNCLQEAEKK